MVATIAATLMAGLFTSQTQVKAATGMSIAVSGNQLVDGSGAPVHLRGVNRSGTEYACVQFGGPFDGPNDQTSVAAIAAWHVNVVRVPLNEDCWLGINGEPCCGLTAAVYQQDIVDYVNLLHANGMYAILELHWSNYGTVKATNQQPMPDRDHSPAFWTSVASRFKADPGVIFDLYNEPFESCSWAQWRDGCTVTQGSPGSQWSYQGAGMQELVTAARAGGALTQPIMLGGLGYANMVAFPGTGAGQGPCCGWLANLPSDPSNSIVLSVHTYDFNWPCPGSLGTSGANAISCYSSGDENLTAIAAAHPIVFGEIGGAAAFITPFMTWMDSQGYGYLAWTWDTWGCSNTVLISNYNGTACTGFGAAYQAHLAAVAGPQTTVVSVAPNSGPAAGGTVVTITGTNLTGATAVKFGTAAATALTGNTATQITATSPAGSGVVDVTVTTPLGTSVISAADHFTYTGPPTVSAVAPSSGPPAGGTPVVITGTNFTGASAVKFGTTAATTFTVTNGTQIAATSPAGTGTVDVTVTTPTGTSAISAADHFTYSPPPTVTAVAPNVGPAAGGTSVVISGTNFTGATAVKFGTAAASMFTVNSATQITATSPLGLATVDVTVTTGGGTSAISAADKFTYVSAPTVVSLAPNNGPIAGGTSVVITGTNFPITIGATVVVKFGTATAATPTVNSATQITATSPAGTGTVDVTVTTAGGTSAMSIADRFAYTLPPAAYTAVTPVRLLDTRNGGSPLGAGGVRNLTVVGVTPGAPAGASAVVLNVTVTNTTAASFLTVYPTGAAQPLASSLNWAAGTTIPGLVTVPVGAGGAITMFNAVGATDVVVDLEGYFAAPSGSAGGEVALTPARITDTRTGSGKPNAGNTLGVGGTVTVQVTGAGGVPASGASAAILNITVTNTSAAGALTVWPTGAVRPLASNLNWVAGQTAPNRVFVPVGSGGQVSIFNFAGSTDVVVDVSGYFTDATASGKLFTAVSPLRLVDTRLTGQTLGTGGSFILQVSGVAGVPSGASAVVLNVTVTNTNAPSFLVEYPSTVGLPTASDLNWVGGQTVANMAVASLGTTGAITFYNGVGSSDVVVDLAGWFS
jgi:hypothetical protein